jgi:predicted RNase H-like HicB family nuclease
MRINIVYWQEEGGWIGYVQEYPDYWTQGDSFADLQEHLKDLYQDLTSDQIPGIRRVGELVIS